MVSSSSTVSNLPPLGAKVSEKLMRENYLLWKAQVTPAIRGADLVPILTGKSREPEPTMEVDGSDGKNITILNLEHQKWIAQDQHLLAHLLNSLTSNILA
jgi:hypothetical protein